MKSKYMSIILICQEKSYTQNIYSHISLSTASQWICELHTQWSVTVTQSYSHKTAGSTVCKSTLIPTALCSHIIISLTSAVSLRIHCILGYNTMLLSEWFLKAVRSFTALETTYSATQHASLISHPLCNITEKLTCKLGWYVRHTSSQSIMYFFFQSLFSALLLLLYR